LNFTILFMLKLDDYKFQCTDKWFGEVIVGIAGLWLRFLCHQHKASQGEIFKDWFQTEIIDFPLEH
ncbi:hypothetical protein L9F63_006078, partial [Diploptera punctata]